MKVGSRVSWSGDAFRAPSHGTVIEVGDHDGRRLLKVETWDGYVFGVFASEATDITEHVCDDECRSRGCSER